jgi:opacity protein-like surface antigen
MREKNIRLVFISLLFFLQGAFAQNDRTQYPSFLSNSYFEVHMGYIQYPFSKAQLEPGYNVESVKVPHMAVRVILLGHRFNKYLSAQVSYMRPVKWVEYESINGDEQSRSVWMGFGSLTLKSQLPLSNKLSLYGEGGLGIVTRKGFMIDNKPVVKDASFGTVFLGGGMEYHLNNKWDLLAGVSYTPPNSKEQQPYSLFYSAGFRYNMRPLSTEKVEAASRSPYIFPKHLIQFGYSTNHFGYAVNNFTSEKVPVFWGGDVQIEKGFTLRYQRNIYHTRKVFALNIGTSVSYWRTSQNKEELFSLALSPVFQFNLVRTRPVDAYLFYSVAGPSYLSKVYLDGLNTGKHFTFQDFMGMGIFTGKKRNINVELHISHYSNGNIFTSNPGLKIPLTFTAGYAF